MGVVMLGLLVLALMGFLSWLSRERDRNLDKRVLKNPICTSSEPMAENQETPATINDTHGDATPAKTGSKTKWVVIVVGSVVVVVVCVAIAAIYLCSAKSESQNSNDDRV